LSLHAYISELSQEVPVAASSNASTSHELSEVNSDDNNGIEGHVEVDLDGGSIFLPRRFMVDPLSVPLFLETNHSAESDRNVIIEQPSTHDTCLKSTTGTASRSSNGPEVVLARGYQSIRAAHYSFDPLTLSLHGYMPELSQVPVAASSNAGTSHELSEVNSDDSNGSEDNIEVDLDGGSRFLPKRFMVDPLSVPLFLETNHFAESNGSVIIEQPFTHDICLESTTGTSSWSPKGPDLVLARGYQSIRAAHYSSDPLTLPLYVYISELTQVPVAASSKADASDGLTEVNSDDSNGSEEIRPWTPYNRRSSTSGDALTGSTGIRQVNPEDGGTSVPFSSESVVNVETRVMKPDQESSLLSSGLLNDSMAMALLVEVNDILEQERCVVSSENSRREICLESTAGSAIRVSKIRKRARVKDYQSIRSIQSSSDALTVPSVQNDFTGSEAIGQVNYFCCDWW
jgi:hypothetical protein